MLHDEVAQGYAWCWNEQGTHLGIVSQLEFVFKFLLNDFPAEPVNIKIDIEYGGCLSIAVDIELLLVWFEYVSEYRLELIVQADAKGHHK